MIEAVQWNGFGRFPKVSDVFETYPDDGVVCDVCGADLHIHGWIGTLEGGHRVCPGDWIITGVQGERYPCKPDIFEQTYEAVEEVSECGKDHGGEDSSKTY